MKHSSPPPSRLLALSFTFLLVFAGCSRASEGEQQAGQSPETAGAAAQGQAAPAQGTQGQPAAPGQPQAAPAQQQAEAEVIAPEKLPAVVAKVDGREIKKEELLEAAGEVESQVAQMGSGAPPRTAQFYRQVLDGLISRMLLEQDAKSQGITVTDDEVKAQLEGLRKRFPTEEAYKQALASEGVSEEELVAEGRQAMAVQKLVDTKVMAAVKVTDEAAKAFYDENQARMKQPERARLRHILVRVDQGATAEDKQKAKAEAEDVLARVKKGEDFAALAKAHSDDPGSKEKGGDLDWIARGQTVEPFEQAAFALKPNETSGVVETQFGYHVIQLLEHQAESTLPFDDVKGQISEFLKERQGQQAVQGHIQALRAKAKVETFI